MNPTGSHREQTNRYQRRQISPGHRLARLGDSPELGAENGKGLGYVWQTHVVEGKPIHLGYLLAAAALYLAATLLTFFRWYLLVRAVSLPFRLVDALRLGLVGLFFNTFLPGSVGGDIIKAAALCASRAGARWRSPRSSWIAPSPCGRWCGSWR